MTKNAAGADREGAGETVTTWADGFGVWHAKVTFPAPGYGDYLDDAFDRIRAKARRAIRKEISLRETANAGAPKFVCRMQVEDSVQDAQGRWRSFTFKEIDCVS